MGDGVGDCACRQFEMRHASAAEAQQQPHGRSVRRRRVRRASTALVSKGFAAIAGTVGRLMGTAAPKTGGRGAAIGGLLERIMTRLTLTATQALDEFARRPPRSSRRRRAGARASGTIAADIRPRCRPIAGEQRRKATGSDDNAAARRQRRSCRDRPQRTRRRRPRIRCAPRCSPSKPGPTGSPRI